MRKYYFVNWTAKAQKAVLKVTNPRRSASNKQICREEWDQINLTMPT